MEGTTGRRSVGSTGGYGRFIAGNAADAAIELGRWDEAEAMLDDLLASDTVGRQSHRDHHVAGAFLGAAGRTRCRRSDAGRGAEARRAAPRSAVHRADLRGARRARARRARPGDGVGAGGGRRGAARGGPRTSTTSRACSAIAARAEADLAETGARSAGDGRPERAVAAARGLCGSGHARDGRRQHQTRGVHGGRLGAFAALAVAEAARAAGYAGSRRLADGGTSVAGDQRRLARGVRAVPDWPRRCSGRRPAPRSRARPVRGARGRDGTSALPASRLDRGDRAARADLTSAATDTTIRP